MLILVSAMLIAGGPVPPTIGEIFYGHAGSHDDPIDITLRPPKVPDCRTDAQIQAALAQKERGEEPACLLPRKIRAADPR